MSEPTKELKQQLAERWKGGERLPSLARDASVVVGRDLACATVRNWIVQELGGPEKFKAASLLRDESHPRTQGFGGGRAVIDDSNVPVIKGKRVGWGLDHITSHGRREDVLIAPDGKRYVHALAQERADLIAISATRGLSPLRLRLEHGSHVAKRMRKEEKLVEQGEEQRNRKFQESFGPEALPIDALARTKPKQVKRKK